MPGIVRLRRSSSRALSTVAACAMKPTAARGLANQCRTPGSTGNRAGKPASGSRTMPEKKPEAAAFGAPGRMQIVGSLMPIPSKKPLRL